MKKGEVLNILFCGTGGQGVLKASELCAQAALLQGFHVKKSEVHGMAQRGGSVESHLRFGRRVFSPLIPKGKADFLVPLHQEEALRFKAMLAPQGRDYSAELRRAEQSIGEKRYLNTFMCGVLSRRLAVKKENWLEAIDIVFGRARGEENKTIFLLAREGKNDLE